jgi:outer membrane protein TolC
MIILLAASLLAVQPDTIRMSFPDAMEQARKSNPRFVRQELSAQNSVISMSNARANRYYPRVNLDFTTPEYVSALRRVVGSDGGEIFVPTERRTVASNLVLDQPLPTGGSVRITGTVTALQQPLAAENQRFTGATFLGIRLTQSMFGINYSIRNYRLARESFARSQAEFADQERDLSRNVLSAYYGLVQARKQAEIDSVVFMRDSVRNVASPIAAGVSAVSEIDSLKFELEAARSAFNRTRSVQSLRRAQATFNEIMALPFDAVVIPDTAITVERFKPDIEEGIRLANQNRHDLRLARMAVDNRRAQLSDAHKTSPIQLSLQSTMGFDGSARAVDPRTAITTAIDAQNRSRTVDLGVSIPLFDRFEERNAVARATNDLRSSENNLADQTRQLESEVRLAAQRVTNASAQLDLAERQSQITTRALEIQTGRYERGEITIVEFLIDQTSSRQAEIGLLQARVELLTANEEWRRAIGQQSRLVQDE